MCGRKQRVKIAAERAGSSIIGAERIRVTVRIGVEVVFMRVCVLLVGLGDVEVLGVDDEAGELLRVHVRHRALRPSCACCGLTVRRQGVWMDLPACGWVVRLVWHKHHRCCLNWVAERDCHWAGSADRAFVVSG